MDLPKIYSPAETEKKWYDRWEAAGYFKPDPGSSRSTPAFCIVIPPPNVTGSLHMGHALNNTVQDILVRWHRMRGDKTLWVPGTDHGGIATQNVVEKLLKDEKTNRQELGRDKFLARMWRWRQKSGDTIFMQLKRLGVSCDWSRSRFTMDDAYSRAVRTAFVRLYQKGLIYRGPRMVNWCPRCLTALADIEVEHEPRAGNLWHIRYPFATPHPPLSPGERVQGEGFVVVATTRPETMLGDTAVAVHPADTRYRQLAGKHLRLPLMNRAIPVVTDAAVDPAFGTGAVKVTPAHDPVDFEIGDRHQLPHEVVIDFKGRMTERAGSYAALDRLEARKRIVADLEAQGYLEKVEPYSLSLAVCYRCLTPIETLVSEQWFLKVKELAARAAEATRDGRVKIFPASWESPYLAWLDHIKDWCISRQIWWGHQIPVYYCPNANRSGLRAEGSAKSSEPRAPSPERRFCEPIASVEPPTKCPRCGSSDLKQDEDVLDTWFSSALWPFAVLGWPDDTDDLKLFYPTSVLVTGHEILYLWVARMVMMGLEFQNQIPFRHVYIHGIVRDKSGKKMSKSLGNVIDPLDIMREYGTDALRFSLASSSAPGRDLQLSNDSFLKARNFTNKLWNASRFVLMNLKDYAPRDIPPSQELELADRWILNELYEAIQRTNGALAGYNPAEACRLLYAFVWSSYCDWYLEIAKTAFQEPSGPARTVKQAVLAHVLAQTLSLLHPFMPYETEEIFQALKLRLGKTLASQMIQPWPDPAPDWSDPAAAAKFRLIQEFVTAIRTVRSEMNIPPAMKIDCKIRAAQPDWAEFLKATEITTMVIFLARIGGLEIGAAYARPPESAVAVFSGGEVYIPLKGLIDMRKEKARLFKNREQILKAIARDQNTYASEEFRRHAPPEEVERVNERIRQSQSKVALLERNLEGL